MKFYKTFFFTTFFTFSSLVNATSNDSLKLTSNEWNEISEGVDYTENYKERKKEPEKKSENKSAVPTNFLNYNFGNLKYVFYCLIIGLVLFIIIRIVINFRKNPVIKETTVGIESIQEIEEKMHELDLDVLLKEALQAKNYRIALRINFLIIIKMLSQKGSIIWAKEKTNWEYYSEVKDKHLSNLLKEIIMSFEPVWYGEHQLNEEQFDLVSPSYENLKKQLAQNE